MTGILTIIIINIGTNIIIHIIVNNNNNNVILGALIQTLFAITTLIIVNINIIIRISAVC